MTSFLSILGTLVVMVPSSSGLVIAADTRGTLPNGTYCDFRKKLVTIENPEKAVLAVTGIGTFYSQPPSGITDLCSYLKKTKPAFDVKEIAKEYMEKNYKDFSIEKLAQHCVEETLKYKNAQKNSMIREFAGKGLYQIILANYDKNSKIATLQRFNVGLLPSGEIKRDEIITKEISPNDPEKFFYFGETDYVDQVVLRGIGQQFLNEPTKKALTGGKAISFVDLEEAKSVALNVIEAVSLSTETIPAASGIGGAIDMLILDGN